MDVISVVKTKNDHTCNMESDERKSEAQVLRVRVRKASGDISKRPSALIRSALQTSTENNLLQLDVTNASKAIYRERRNIFPALPKSKDDVHDAVEILDTKTNKSENFVISNDRDSGITGIIFSTLTNLQCTCMCSIMDELFIDGTFKCCPRYLCQLYTIHGLKNGNYVPLVFCLLPSKTEICYNIAMWSLIINNILLKILLPPPRGEQGATGIILANGRGTFWEKEH